MTLLDIFPPLGDSSLVAPAGGLALIVWLMWQAAKHYKEGRRIDVQAAEEREKAAERRASDLESSLRHDLTELREQLATERRERTAAESAHDKEVQTLRVRINRVSRQNYDLMQIVIQAGLGDKIENYLDVSETDIV